MRVVEDAAGVAEGAALDLEVGVDLAQFLPESVVVAGLLVSAGQAVERGKGRGDGTKMTTMARPNGPPVSICSRARKARTGPPPSGGSSKK